MKTALALLLFLLASCAHRRNKLYTEICVCDDGKGLHFTAERVVSQEEMSYPMASYCRCEYHEPK